jgi:hypothetical protein
MLLAAIDERHRGTYDFIYLPIDFKASAFLFGLFPLTLSRIEPGI